MKNYLTILVLALLMGCQTTKNMGSAENNKPEAQASEKTEHDLSMYPEPTEDLQRHIIILAKEENEADYKIELYAGKTMEVDCNKHTLAGEFEKKSVEGWGYPYFEFKTSGHVMSTRMACPEDSWHKAFVEAPSILKRYNSKLPLVVYTPKGYEVRYRVWKHEGAEYKVAQE